jgi:AcrR family transcriptional regulator
MTSWQRARSEEQVAQRVEELVAAAGRLYEREPFDGITIAAVAREAGWTRSNVYKYFDTVEEIFLRMLAGDLAAWRRDVVGRFAGRQCQPGEFAEERTELYLRHERLTHLLTFLYTVLEKKSGADRLAEFKARGLEEFAHVATAIRRVLGFRDPGAVIEFLFAQFALIMGARPMWSQTDQQREASTRAGMMQDADYFRRMFTRSIEALLEAAMRR